MRRVIGEQVGAGRDPHPGLGQGRHHLVQGFLDLSTCDRSMAMDQSWWVLGGFPELTAAFDHVLDAIFGQRVIPGVRIGAPGPARRLLYVTGRCVYAAWRRDTPYRRHRSTNRSTALTAVTIIAGSVTCSMDRNAPSSPYSMTHKSLESNSQ